MDVSSPPAPGGASPQRVLLVEDDVDIQEAMLDILVEEGFVVHVAGHGQQALHILRDKLFFPDVILLDLMMPVMDGWTFRKEQLQDPALQHIPVVVVSADRAACKKAADMQVDRCLTKPVNLLKLLETLAELHP